MKRYGPSGPCASEERLAKLSLLNGGGSTYPFSIGDTNALLVGGLVLAGDVHQVAWPALRRWDDSGRDERHGVRVHGWLRGAGSTTHSGAQFQPPGPIQGG